VSDLRFSVEVMIWRFFAGLSGSASQFLQIVRSYRPVSVYCAVVPTRICLSSLSTNILQILRQRKVIFYLSLRRRNGNFVLTGVSCGWRPVSLLCSYATLFMLSIASFSAADQTCGE
jgi:hypothetical protein